MEFCWGTRGWPGGICCAWLSSGESTWLSSTPLASPLEGSGAFRHACGGLAGCCDRCIGRAALALAYLDEVLALGLGDERLQLWCREGVDKARLRDDEQQHLGAGEDRQLVGLVQRVSRRAMSAMQNAGGRAPPWRAGARRISRAGGGHVPSS